MLWDEACGRKDQKTTCAVGATHVKQAFFVIPEIVIVMKTIPALLDVSIILNPTVDRSFFSLAP